MLARVRTQRCSAAASLAAGASAGGGFGGWLASPSSAPSPCCLIWLASAPPAPINWLASFAPGDRIWPTRMLSCSCAAGPLADLLDLVGRQPLRRPSRRRVAANGVELLVARRAGRLPWPARRCPRRPRRRPACRRRPRTPAAKRRALGRPPGQAVLDHQQLDVLLRAARLRSATLCVGVRPTTFTSSSVVDAVQPLAAGRW